METRTINVQTIYGETAKLLAGSGNHIILTGPEPVWLYLSLAHELHGLCLSLSYDSPASGVVTIFNHNPH